VTETVVRTPGEERDTPGESKSATAPEAASTGPRLAEAEVRSVAKEGGWAGIFNVLGAGVRYVNQLILTRILGAEAYGLYALANVVVTVVAVPVGLGLPTSSVHFIASSAGTGEWGRLRWVVRAAFKLTLFSSLVGTLVIVGLGPWASHALFHKDVLSLPLMGLGLAMPLLALYLVCAGGLQGLKRIREKVFIERIAHPLVFTGLLLLGGFYLRSLEYVLCCFFLGAAAVFGLAAFWFGKRLRELPAAQPGPPAWRELFSFSTPVMFMNLLQQFMLQSDGLVMGGFRGAKEVGIYILSSALAKGVSFPTDALGASLAPNFSSLVSQGDRAGLKRLFHTSTRWIFLLGTFVGLGLILAGPPILHLFGKDFTGGYVFLCLLAGGQMVSAAFGANGTLITMTGHPKVNLANSLCLGAGNLGLCLLLVPRFGGLGAAVAAASSFAVVNVARAVEIALILKLGPWDRTIRKPMVAFVLACLAGWAAYRWGHPYAGPFVGLGVYAILWKLLGPEPEDLDMLKTALAKFRVGKR
jgi:O-antigen/teichoic acid export membrane protein